MAAKKREATPVEVLEAALYSLRLDYERQSHLLSDFEHNSHALEEWGERGWGQSEGNAALLPPAEMWPFLRSFANWEGPINPTFWYQLKYQIEECYKHFAQETPLTGKEQSQ